MLTQEQWFNKLSSFVPKWVLQENKNAEAHFWGLAKVLETLQVDVYNHLRETFITTASGEFLDILGNDRNKYRYTRELEESFRQRIREIINSVTYSAIKSLVDSMLINGECTIIEHYKSSLFYNRSAFYNRNAIPVDDLTYNFFTIVINHQIPEATTFYNRENFYNRDFALGAVNSSIELFEGIINAVNENKALGTEYRLIERTGN